MHSRIGLFAFLVLFAAGLCACGDAGDSGGATSSIIVKKNIRQKKKGRIYEKVNVVQVPLTAAENNLHGKVHTVKYRAYKLNDGGKKVLNDSGYNVYDTAGHLTEQNAWGSKGKRKWKCVFTYDANGRLTEWNLDMQGRGEKDTTVFFYDAKGNKIKAVSRTNDIMRAGRKEYRYDGMGNETDMVEYSLAGRVRKHTHSKYDKRDNQVLLADLFPDGTPYVSRLAEYDGYGSITLLTLYLGDSISTRTIMVNDAMGKHIEIKSFAADSVYQGKSVYAYDPSGNMLERVSYSAKNGGDITSHLFFEYEYDSNGNITRQTAGAMQQQKRVRKEYIDYEYTYYQ